MESALDSRLQRVGALYDQIIDRVIDGLRADVHADGLDPSVLDDLRKVRAPCPTQARTQNA